MSFTYAEICISAVIPTTSVYLLNSYRQQFILTIIRCNRYFLTTVQQQILSKRQKLCLRKYLVTNTSHVKAQQVLSKYIP